MSYRQSPGSGYKARQHSLIPHGMMIKVLKKTERGETKVSSVVLVTPQLDDPYSRYTIHSSVPKSKFAYEETFKLAKKRLAAEVDKLKKNGWKELSE